MSGEDPRSYPVIGQGSAAKFDQMLNWVCLSFGSIRSLQESIQEKTEEQSLKFQVVSELFVEAERFIWLAGNPIRQRINSI